MKTIQLVVAPDGSSRLETCGFAGDACRDASRFLEEALGVRLSETLMPEFHAEAVEQAQAREQA